jgi:hypothetical protein
MTTPFPKSGHRPESEDRRHPKAFFPYLLLWAVCLAALAFAAMMLVVLS